jgi:hypothetical protein
MKYLNLHVWWTKLMFLEQAEANLEHLKPLHIVKPVNPKYTAQEWQEIYVA